MAAGDLITTDGQIEWGGVLLGSGTAYRWLELTGLEDLPGIDSGNVSRPARHGSWPGIAYAQERTITWSSQVSTEPIDFGTAVRALRQATALSSDDVDAPLVIRTKGGEERLAYGRIRNRAIPNEKDAGIGRVKATIAWVCADPRLYSVDEHDTEIPQPSGGSGLTYPLIYPLDWGAGGESGSRLILNDGDTPSSPRIEITGPCTTPAVTLVASGRTIELDLTIGSGETVVIDTAAGTIEIDGADRLYALTARSVPPELFELPSGTTEVAFRAESFGGGATATIFWRDANL